MSECFVSGAGARCVKANCQPRPDMQALKLAEFHILAAGGAGARIGLQGTSLPRGWCWASPLTSVKFSAVSRGRGDAGSAP